MPGSAENDEREREPAKRLPFPARFFVIVPGTLLLVGLLGLFLSLPPGPLCDGGMVRFLEGGCDWGQTNEFFFAKIGLIASANFAFVLCLGRRRVALTGFVPHLLLLGVFAATMAGDRSCDAYYAHPRINLGQMAIEMSAFAILGLSILKALRGRSVLFGGVALLAWNVIHVVVFYAWADITEYWRWTHVAMVTATLVALAVLIVLLSKERRRRDASGHIIDLPA